MIRDGDLNNRRFVSLLLTVHPSSDGLDHLVVLEDVVDMSDGIVVMSRVLVEEEKKEEKKGKVGSESDFGIGADLAQSTGSRAEPSFSLISCLSTQSCSSL